MRNFKKIGASNNLSAILAPYNLLSRSTRDFYLANPQKWILAGDSFCFLLARSQTTSA
jgi:hypothetical protein